ncbi:hypothetical protein BH683_008975 [Williamsia sp. 1138]|uniref:YgaP family membrane protein n=1 Tax=Williamsia sp. 1138 TaxID=1903117 RepID=UPI000A120EE0|nr:DUF2892 domain-containing protein [Williamsia sp. 1138]OZG29559.1 hypothetical protein BH683_008975 [Williamsia sp. 1138]
MNTHTTTPNWTVERAVPLMAGIVVLSSLVLAITLSQWWLLLTAFVAVNLLFYSVVGWCPASKLMHRLGLPYQSELH